MPYKLISWKHHYHWKTFKWALENNHNSNNHLHLGNVFCPFPPSEYLTLLYLGFVWFPASLLFLKLCSLSLCVMRLWRLRGLWSSREGAPLFTLHSGPRSETRKLWNPLIPVEKSFILNGLISHIVNWGAIQGNIKANNNCLLT